jgi:hypothetical protein
MTRQVTPYALHCRLTASGFTRYVRVTVPASSCFLSPRLSSRRAHDQSNPYLSLSRARALLPAHAALVALHGEPVTMRRSFLPNHQLWASSPDSSRLRVALEF